MKRILTSKIFLMVLTLLPVLLLMGMIYGFSAQPGEKSMETSGEVVDIVLDVTEPELEQKPIEEQEIIISNTQFWVRKTAHFSEFCALGFFLALHCLLWSKRFYPLFAGLIGVLYAVSDELHQMKVGSRTPQIRDVLIDSTGVFFGIVILVLLYALIKHILSSRKIQKKA